MPQEPARGIRNNNPGNIDRNATKWQGMAAAQSDPRFVVFISPQFGIRALARTLLTYQSQHNLKTIRQIINRWAPPVENNTDAYVRAVAEKVGVYPDEAVEVDSIATMLPLVKAIITHENGRNPYSDAVILEGIRLAGVHDAKPKPLAKQTSFVTKAAGGAALGLATIGEYATPIKQGADTLAPMSGSPWVQKAITALLTLAAVCVVASLVSSWLKQRAAT